MRCDLEATSILPEMQLAPNLQEKLVIGSREHGD